MRNQLAAGLNMGLAGIPWWTTDIGGFHGGDPNDPAFRELFARWFAWGAFCPVMRLHGDREPRQPQVGTTGGAACRSGAASEVNIGTSDFILLLAKQDEIENGKLDTTKIKAFRVPAGVAEVYTTTLHYAPCHVDEAEGFRVAVVPPKGTNEPKPAIIPVTEEDRWLWARNKWLLAHPKSSEAGQGAYVGLAGENIDIATQI